MLKFSWVKFIEEQQDKLSEDIVKEGLEDGS